MTEVGFVLADEAVKIVVASIDWGDVRQDQARLAADPRRRTVRGYQSGPHPPDRGRAGASTGAIVAAIAVAAGIQPVAIGKPEPTMFEPAMARMGAMPATTATLGSHRHRYRRRRASRLFDHSRALRLHGPPGGRDVPP